MRWVDADCDMGSLCRTTPAVISGCLRYAVIHFSFFADASILLSPLPHSSLELSLSLAPRPHSLAGSDRGIEHALARA